MTSRIKVRNHYRIVIRDPKGKFVSVKKWKPQKEGEHEKE